MADIVVIAAHPQFQHSHVQRALLAAAARVPGVELRELHRRYPDYAIDVEAEQAALERAHLVVWLHPTHWYAMPALMKLWLDEVLAFGWAYGPGGTALRGKDLWLVTSTGGSEASYTPAGHNRRAFADYLHPHEQTAAVCGMRWLAPRVLHGAHRVDDAALARHAEAFAEQLRRYPDWPGLQDLRCDECAVPADERPASAAA